MMQHNIGNLVFMILFLLVICMALKHYAGRPYHLMTRAVKRCGRRIWNVVYRTPASRRGPGFGIFWLASWVWAVFLINSIFHQGSGWITVLVLGLIIVGYKLALDRWQRTHRVQRPLPRRREWR